MVVVERAQTYHLTPFALQADVLGDNVNNIVGLLNLKNSILVVNSGHIPLASTLVNVLDLPADGLLGWPLRRQRVCQYIKIGIAGWRRKVKSESKKCVFDASDRPMIYSKATICDFRQIVCRKLKFRQAISR